MPEADGETAEFVEVVVAVAEERAPTPGRGLAPLDAWVVLGVGYEIWERFAVLAPPPELPLEFSRSPRFLARSGEMDPFPDLDLVRVVVVVGSVMTMGCRRPSSASVL